MTLPTAGITVAVPTGWTGTEDPSAGILALESPDGIDIRITATEQPLQVDQVFSALREEGWIELSASREPGFQLGLFRLGTEHIAVGVVDRTTLPSGVIYGRRNSAWTQTQQAFILSLASQIAKQP